MKTILSDFQKTTPQRSGYEKSPTLLFERSKKIREKNFFRIGPRPARIRKRFQSASWRRENTLSYVLPK